MAKSHLERWKLAIDFKSRGDCRHLMVLRGDARAVLRLTGEEDERLSARLVEWWDGSGGEPFIRRDRHALLVERPVDDRSLVEMVGAGREAEACRILVSVAARLHANAAPRPVVAIPVMTEDMQTLRTAASNHGDVFDRCSELADELLAAPREAVVLHGDFHFDFVRDFGPRGWLATEPLGVVGERSAEFASLIANPLAIDDVDGRIDLAVLTRRADLIAEASGFERPRLLKWAAIYASLTAAKLLPEGGRLAENALLTVRWLVAETDR